MMGLRGESMNPMTIGNMTHPKGTLGWLGQHRDSVQIKILKQKVPQRWSADFTPP